MIGQKSSEIRARACRLSRWMFRAREYHDAASASMPSTRWQTRRRTLIRSTNTDTAQANRDAGGRGKPDYTWYHRWLLRAFADASKLRVPAEIARKEPWLF
jgi:hypothetical protein